MQPELDASVLESFRLAVGEDGFTEIVGAYLEAIPREFERLESAVARSDCAAVVGSAHNLKAHVGTLGARALGETFDTVEGLARRGDLAAALPLVAGAAPRVGALVVKLRAVVDPPRG